MMRMMAVAANVGTSGGYNVLDPMKVVRTSFVQSLVINGNCWLCRLLITFHIEPLEQYIYLDHQHDGVGY